MKRIEERKRVEKEMEEKMKDKAAHSSTMANFHFNRAVEEDKVGNFQEALKQYTNALEINPWDYFTYFTKANVLRKLCRYEEAIEEYTRSLCFKKEVRTFNNRALTYDYMKEYSLSKEDYDKGIQIKPDYKLLYDNKEKLLNKMRLVEEEVMVKVEYHHNLAILYSIKKEFDKAVEEFILKGNFLFEYGKFHQSLSAYHFALQIYNQNINSNSFSLEDKDNNNDNNPVNNNEINNINLDNNNNNNNNNNDNKLIEDDDKNKDNKDKKIGENCVVKIGERKKLLNKLQKKIEETKNIIEKRPFYRLFRHISFKTKMVFTPKGEHKKLIHPFIPYVTPIAIMILLYFEEVFTAFSFTKFSLISFSAK